MDTQPKAPKPLTEAQRNEVRTLLKQLSAVSASRRSRTRNRNPLSRKKIKKVKRIENPFDGIDEGKTVQLAARFVTCLNTANKNEATDTQTGSIRAMVYL